MHTHSDFHNRKYLQMKLQMLLLLVALIALSSSRSQPLIPLPQRPYSQSFTFCSDPKFNSCPDFFILIYDPKFCALNRDGTWQSYTFECQACQNPDVIGVEDGQCIDGRPQNQIRPIDDSCAAVTCLTGTVCKNGRCISLGRPNWPERDSCSFVKCWRGTSCQDGICVPDYNIDRCATIRCIQGTTCRNGKCVPTQGWCSEDTDCKKNEICL